jgi:hypothetical protein
MLPGPKSEAHVSPGETVCSQAQEYAGDTAWAQQSAPVQLDIVFGPRGKVGPHSQFPGPPAGPPAYAQTTDRHWHEPPLFATGLGHPSAAQQTLLGMVLVEHERLVEHEGPAKHETEPSGLGSTAWTSQVHPRLLPEHTTSGVPVDPTQAPSTQVCGETQSLSDVQLPFAGGHETPGSQAGAAASGPPELLVPRQPATTPSATATDHVAANPKRPPSRGTLRLAAALK